MAIPEPWVLSIDRTNWQFGDCVFNILMLGVVHEGIAFPLVWVALDKCGNSNTQERAKLFNRFLEYFPEREVAFLAADREFVLIGEWLHDLQPLVIKKHGRRAKSLFRYGYDYLRSIVFNFESRMDDFLLVLQFLSCT